MKIRWIAIYLIFAGVLTFRPLPASCETTGSPVSPKANTVLPLPPEDEPADGVQEEESLSTPSVGDDEVSPDEETASDVDQPPPAVAEQPASKAGSLPDSEEGAKQTAEQQPLSAADNQQRFSYPQTEKKSWMGSLMHKLGLGPDPEPGETVQSPGESNGATGEYIIGPGDQIGISVWRDENMSRTVVVLPDGKISFPLVGEIVAGGKTVAQLKKELETKLSRYISDTAVTVEVKQSNSMIIYVIGRVNAPGRQLLLARTDVLQALAMVGGPNPFADKSDIKIFRKEDGKTLMFPFNYDDVSEGRHLETNIELKRGDVIIVP